MPCDPAKHLSQISVTPCLNGRSHLALRQPITGHCALEQLDGHRHVVVPRAMPLSMMDVARSTLPQQMLHVEIRPADFIDLISALQSGFQTGHKWIA